MPECGICGIKFSNKENLMKHCRIHREKVGYPCTPDPARINRQNRKKSFTSTMFDFTLRGIERVAPYRNCRRPEMACMPDQNQNSVQNPVPEPELQRLPEYHPLNRKRQLRPMSPGTPAKKTRSYNAIKDKREVREIKVNIKLKLYFKSVFIFLIFSDNPKRNEEKED